VPGQPVSWDAAYVTGKMPVKRRGTPMHNTDGSPRYIHRPVLTREGQQWKNDVQLLVQAAKPSAFHPAGQIRLIVDLYLAHDMDDDNAMKLTRDAAAKAIGVDDMRFLVCTRVKEIVDPKKAHVRLTFDDNPRAH
jgi:hypothetical protein